MRMESLVNMFCIALDGDYICMELYTKNLFHICIKYQYISQKLLKSLEGILILI